MINSHQCIPKAEHSQRFEDTAADAMLEDLVVEERDCTAAASMDRGSRQEWHCEDCHLEIVALPIGHVGFLRELVSIGPGWAKKS